MLADRVGIIDHGRIVAEGTPAALKAEIGRPSVDAVPTDPASARRIARRPRALRRAAAGRPARRRRGPPARRRSRLADVVRALDAEGIGRRRPRAARADARRRLPREDRPLARRAPDERRGGGRAPAGDGQRDGVATRSARSRAARSSARRVSRPASSSPLDLPAVPARGQRGRPQGRDRPARLPDRLVPHLRSRRAVHAGGLFASPTPAPTSRATSRPASSTGSR